MIAVIGRGGMGIVYEGLHPLIGKRVAVKVLTEEASLQQEAVDRFLAEARAVNAIRHRGIVDIFGFGQLPGGQQYFVMELLEGMPFDEVIKARGPIPAAQALRWVDEVLDALEAAHRQGVIHRDIKPSNLFLVDNGRGQPYVKLLDFGIAKLSVDRGHSTPKTGKDSLIGTPDYMAPEQAQAKPISGATDLYALGCVLFELLTGQRIFRANSALEVMFAHVDRLPRPPSEVNRRVPQIVDRLVLHLVSKKPEDRPRDARAAREEVAAVLAALGAGSTAQADSGRTVRVAAREGQTLIDPAPRSFLGPAIAISVLVVGGALAIAFLPARASKTRIEEPVAAIDAGVAALQPPLDSGATPAPTAIVDAGAEVDVAMAPLLPVDAGTGLVRPRPSVPTREALTARLGRLTNRLAERDRSRGEPDRVLHQLLDAAERSLAAAKGAEDRRGVAQRFDDLDAQLR